MAYYCPTSGQIKIGDIQAVWTFCSRAAPSNLHAYAGQTVYNAAFTAFIVPSANLDIEFFYGKGPLNLDPGGGGGGGK